MRINLKPHPHSLNVRLGVQVSVRIKRRLLITRQIKRRIKRRIKRQKDSNTYPISALPDSSSTGMLLVVLE